MRLTAISAKAWKERIRNRNLLLAQLLFPAVFMLVFGLAFRGGGFGTSTPYEILVINEDAGAYLDGARNFGDELLDILADVTYENSTTNRFILANATEEDSAELLKDRNVNCVIIIPPEFSEAVVSTINGTIREVLAALISEGYLGQEVPLPVAKEIQATLVIQGDPGYQGFGAAQSMFQATLAGFLDSVKETAREETLAAFPGAPPTTVPGNRVTLEIDSILGSSEASVFDYYAPGIMVFGLLLGVIAAAEALAREVETGTLTRLKVSMMSSFDLLFGSLIPWALFAAFQVLILFGVALALGYNWSGGVVSLAAAMLIGAIVGVAGVALGMLIAAFAKGQEHASNLGTLVAVPMSFVVGVFFSFPPGIVTKVTALLPWRQGLLSLLAVLSYGDSIESVLPNIAAMVIETAVIFTLGVVAFSRMKLKT